MANSSKNWWLMGVLVVVFAGVVLFAASQQKSTHKAVVLEDVVSIDPITSPAIITSPTNGHEADFSIQVYSFQDKDRAEKALQAIKNDGHNAFMEVSQLGEKGTWYRVRIGGIKDEAQARSMLENIRRNYNGGFIVKPKK